MISTYVAPKWEPLDIDVPSMKAESLLTYAIFQSEPYPIREFPESVVIYSYVARPVNAAAREIMRRLQEWERAHQ